MKKVNTKFKDNLITEVEEKIQKPTRLIKKIRRAVKLAQKEPATRSPLEWEKLEENLQGIMKQWQHQQVREIIKQFLTEIKVSLRQKENIILRGYFSLKIRRSAARQARNPQTGEPMTIKEQNRLSFRASQKLKEEIN